MQREVRDAGVSQARVRRRREQHGALAGCTAAPKCGVDVAVATPKGYEPGAAVTANARADAAAAGTTILITHSKEEAVAEPHVVYTDVWASMGQEAEQQKRVRDFAGWTVTNALLARRVARRRLHALPARPPRRGGRGRGVRRPALRDLRRGGEPPPRAEGDPRHSDGPPLRRRLALAAACCALQLGRGLPEERPVAPSPAGPPDDRGVVTLERVAARRRRRGNPRRSSRWHAAPRSRFAKPAATRCTSWPTAGTSGYRPTASSGWPTARRESDGRPPWRTFPLSRARRRVLPDPARSRLRRRAVGNAR